MIGTTHKIKLSSKSKQQYTHHVSYCHTLKMFLTMMLLPSINSLSIYPNPFSAKATIKSDQYNPIERIEMYNLRGQHINSVEFVKQTTTEWKIEIDPKLPAGIYLIRCTVLDGNKERIVTKKLLLN